MVKLRIIGTVILTALLPFVSWAQNHHTQWAKTVGGNSAESARGVCQDNQGNIYVTGEFRGMVDFDPSPGLHIFQSRNNSIDIFLLKLDVKGNFIWAKQIGGNSNDYVSKIAMNENGYLFLNGFYEDSTSLDPNDSSNAKYVGLGRYDAFVLKLDEDGDLQKSISFGTKGEDYATSMVINHQNQIIVGGFQNQNPDFIYDEYYSSVRTYDSNLNLLDITFFNSGNLTISSLALTKDDELIVAGLFYGSIDADPGIGNHVLISKGLSDIFIIKFGPTLNYKWSASMGGSDYENAIFITTDDSGNVYGTGSFRQIIDFDPGNKTFNIKSAGDRDAFVLKLDKAGNFKWANTIGSNYTEMGTSICIDPSQTLHVSGFFGGKVDLDPGPNTFMAIPNGQIDFYLMQMDLDGSFLGGSSIGGKENDYCTALIPGNQSGVLAIGTFQNIVDFQPGKSVLTASSNGNSDLFVLNLKTCNTYLDIENTQRCEPIFWHGLAINKTGIYNDTFISQYGCDSINSLYFILDTINTYVIKSDTTLESQDLNATKYRWIDCTNNQPLADGNSRSYQPTRSGNYKVIIEKDGCADTSACLPFFALSTLEKNNYKYTIYPNPASHFIQIEGEGILSSNTQVKLIDIHGKEIALVLDKSGNISLKQIALATGIYMLQIREENYLQNIRLLIQQD